MIGGAAEEIPPRGTSEVSVGVRDAAQRQQRRRRIFRWRRGMIRGLLQNVV